MTGRKVVLYNGNDGKTYFTNTLSGKFANRCNNRGVMVVNYLQDGLQNGAPNGFALVDAQDNVIEFLSYEGSFAATNGQATGITSTNIGFSENGTASGTRSSAHPTAPGRPRRHRRALVRAIRTTSHRRRRRVS